MQLVVGCPPPLVININCVDHSGDPVDHCVDHLGCHGNHVNHHGDCGDHGNDCQGGHKYGPHCH